MKLAAALALALALAAPAFAQVAPRTNYAELQKAAAADPAIRKAFGTQGRSVEAQLRDDSRATALILSQTAAKPGMRVLDIGSGGGYLATLLASIVTETGHVDIHNTPGWINQFPSMDPSVQKARIKRANIGYVTTRWNDRRFNVFRPGVRGRTDRFIATFVKPG